VGVYKPLSLIREYNMLLSYSSPLEGRGKVRVIMRGLRGYLPLINYVNNLMNF